MKHPAALEDYLVEKFGRVFVHGAHYSTFARGMYAARQLARMTNVDVDAVVERVKATYQERREAR